MSGTLCCSGLGTLLGVWRAALAWTSDHRQACRWLSLRVGLAHSEDSGFSRRCDHH